MDIQNFIHHIVKQDFAKAHSSLQEIINRKVQDLLCEDVIAYHGSPNARFSKFDSLFVGSGSDAGNSGSRGWGFYFSANPTIANAYSGQIAYSTTYKDKTAAEWLRLKKYRQGSSEEQKIALIIYSALSLINFSATLWAEETGNDRNTASHLAADNLDVIIDEAHFQLKRVLELKDADDAYRQKRIYDWITKNREDIGIQVKDVFTFYKVNLKVKDSDLLEWDAEVKDLHPRIKQKLASIFEKEEMDNTTGAWDLYWLLAKKHGMKGASEELLRAGIKGTKFIADDHVDGVTMEEHYNYIIFDESLIEILEIDKKPV